MARGYFPLTSKEQKKYSFSLQGVETLRGSKIFRVRFVPRHKDDWGWRSLD